MDALKRGWLVRKYSYANIKAGRSNNRYSAGGRLVFISTKPWQRIKVKIIIHNIKSKLIKKNVEQMIITIVQASTVVKYW